MNSDEKMPARACAAEIGESFLLAPPDDEKVYCVLDLCAPETAQAVIEPILSMHPGEDRAAAVSIWSQWYFALLLAPWTRINMLYNWQLPFLPQSIRFTQSESAVPHRFILADSGRAVPSGEGAARFDELIDQHLAPVCRTLSRLAGIKPGLFWNNAGIRLVHGLDMAQQQGADITLAAAFLALRTLADGTPNRLYQPVRQIPQPSGPPKIIRRLCCLRYKLAGFEYCPSCPRVDAQLRKAGRGR